MEQMAVDGESADVVIMDPPRSGSTEAFLHAAAHMSPKRIVYISCNPETQARDLHVLKDLGYVAREVWPYDFFPWTGHIESVVLITRT